MNRSYVGFDPSFTAFGITIIDDELKRVTLCELSSPVDKHKIIHNWDCVASLTRQVKKVVRSQTSDVIIVGQEVPSTYTGWFIGELFALGYSLSQMVNNLTEPRVQAYDCYTPAMLTTVHGRKGTTKYDTIKLVMDILIPVLEGHGYHINVLKTERYRTNDKDPEHPTRYIYRDNCITDGEADSFIYAVKQYVTYNKDSHLAQDLLAHCPNLEKGKVLQ